MPEKSSAKKNNELMSSIFPLLNNTFPFFISKYSSFVTVKYKTVFIMETHEEKKEEAIQRSEEVQTIIDRMPTRGATYAIGLTSLLVTIIISLGFIIKYPDTVDGQISITAHLAPIKLVANASGKLHLICKDRNSINEGQIIAYIENEANYRDVLLLDSLLMIHNNNLEDFPSVPELILGSISSAFNSFSIAHSQYYRALHSDIYKIMCNSLQQQNMINADIIKNLDKELLLKEKKLKIEGELLNRDSTLNQVKAISTQEYNRQQGSYYDLQSVYKELQSSRLSHMAQIRRNEQQIQQYILEEQEKLEKLKEDLSACKFQLTNIIYTWKKQYLQISPLDGQLEYLGFWRENYFVQNRQELFSILPNQNEIVGEVIVPSFGIASGEPIFNIVPDEKGLLMGKALLPAERSGKVKIGQTANIKVSNYPYMEYGLIKGKVSSISRISNKIEQSSTDATKEGNVYRVLISFPDGLKTNFDQTLDLDFESHGTVFLII